MIVRDQPSPWVLFFILRGSITTQILPQIIFIAGIGTVVAWLQIHYSDIFPSYSTGPFMLLGVALSLFLGFRNNACYDRWWEARRHWGQLIVDARSIARQVNSYLDDETDECRRIKQRMIRLAIAFSHTLRHQLRRTDPWNDISPYLETGDLTQLKSSRNLADKILFLMHQELALCLKQGLLSDIIVRAIDDRLTSLTNVQAACERIQNTRLPFAYMLLVQRTAYLYCFLLPFGLVSSLGMATPLACAIVAYTFFGLDALSAELGDPFGLAPNHLALNAMTRTIEIDLLETLGETGLPQPLEPTNHMLN